VCVSLLPKDVHLSVRFSKKIISGFLKHHKDFLSSKDINLKDGAVLSYISRAKAKGLSAKDFIAEHKATKDHRSSDFDPQDDIQHVVGSVYQQYEKALRQSSSLDFDDLLLFGVKLFTEHPPATSWCRHVLVDELYVVDSLCCGDDLKVI
jgi:DNA helicase-2/ATP-dependent DNA helicase PcrA